jgi:methylenetetrahydrofolate dehydrogenase (NADP+)/methenyltetrahydrofolate cyclohydrolase
MDSPAQYGRKIDGRECARVLKAQLATRVSRLHENGITPGLGTILVGNDIGSEKYVAGKQRDCRQVGITPLAVHLPHDATQEDVLAAVQKFNTDPNCTGFLVQLPLPSQINEETILAHIDPSKDMDGMTARNLGALFLSLNQAPSSPQPCTARGIIELLKWGGISLNGKHVVVIGRGITAGRPLGLMLTRRDVNATVTLCHTGTRDLAGYTRQADVIVSAAGSAHLITPDMMKKGAVLVDVGVTRGPVNPATGKSHIVGDIDPACYPLCNAYTPNPGGVGPMTRTMLLTNVVEAAEQQLAAQKRASV